VAPLLQLAFARKHQLHPQLFFDRLFAEFKCGSCLQNTLLPSLINTLMLPPRSVRQFQAAEVRRLLHRATTRSRLLCAVVPLNPFVYITHSLQQAPQRCFIIPDIAMYEITARS
jgi:hypothetical protein